MKKKQLIKTYIKRIERKLQLPREVKKRVISDFTSSIYGREETGESFEEIIESLGTPKEVARQLNEQMKEYTFVKSPWRFVFVGIILLCLIDLGMSVWGVSRAVSIIGGADGPTSVFVAAKTTPIWWGEWKWWIGIGLGVFGYYRFSRCKRK